MVKFDASRILMRYDLSYFRTKKWSFVLIENGKIVFKSKAQQLKPLIFCVKNYKREMRGGIVFDKIIGRAAAYLLVYAKVGEVWTPTISKNAKRILAKSKIKVAYKKEARCIMNRKGDDLCPMEKMSRKMPEKEFIAKILKI